METVTLKINSKNPKGQVLIAFLKQYVRNDRAVEIIKEPNEETLQAMKEIEEGKAEEITLAQFKKQLGL
jgi:hypothetical protein